MKKVLLGLLAVSAVSMAAAPNLGATPTNGTNVFQIGQGGAIKVTGRMSSTVPAVRYVIFATSDGGTTKESELALTEFVMTKPGQSGGGFKGTNPEVRVQRIEGGKYAPLGASDRISFKIETEHTGVNAQPWVATGGKTWALPATAFLSKGTMNTIMTDLGSMGYLKVNNFGNFIWTEEGRECYYATDRAIIATSTTNGIIKVLDEKSTLDAKTAPMSTTYPAIQNKLDTIFAGGKSGINAKIMVKID